MPNSQDRELAFPEHFRCAGTVTSDEISCTTDSFVISRNKYTYRTEIRFSAHVGSENRTAIRELLSKGKCRFSATSTVGPLIADCFALAGDDNKLEGTVQWFDYASSQVPNTTTWDIAAVQFTPTDLAQPAVSNVVRYWTGEVKGRPDDSRVMRLTTAVGDGTFSRNVAFEDAVVGDLEVDVHIPVPTLVLQLTGVLRESPASEVLDAISTTAASIEPVISFLSRRQVRWVETQLLSKREQGTQLFEVRRLRSVFGSQKPPQPLIWPARLGQDNLAQIYRNYVDSPYRESIEHAVIYLNAHWQQGFIEEQFANAFTAFETVVNGVTAVDGNDRSLSDEDFRDLKRSLAESIANFAAVNNLDNRWRGEMYARLSELGRRSIVPRALELLDRYSVPWRIMWRGGADIGSELREAYKRRSIFLHTGRIVDFDQVRADSVRVHFLAEQLVYRILGANKDWLHSFAYSPPAR